MEKTIKILKEKGIIDNMIRAHVDTKDMIKAHTDTDGGSDGVSTRFVGAVMCLETLRNQDLLEVFNHEMRDKAIQEITDYVNAELKKPDPKEEPKEAEPKEETNSSESKLSSVVGEFITTILESIVDDLK